MELTKKVEEYVDFLSCLDGPAFVVDKMAWILLSRFNKETGLKNKMSETYKYALKAGSSGRLLDKESWNTAYGDGCDFYPDMDALALGYFPYEYKNISFDNGFFEHVEDFLSSAPEGLKGSEQLRREAELFNLFEWSEGHEEGLYLDYNVEVISNVVRTEKIDSVLKRLESPGEYTDYYYGTGDIIGFYIEEGNTLYHFTLFANYDETIYVAEESRRPSYFLELLLLDLLIEEQKGGRDV